MNPGFESPCLVKQRTGKRCQSCAHSHASGADRYERIRARGLCARCHVLEAVRGVFCAECYDVEATRREKRKRTPDRRIRCHICWEYGHMGKTCAASRSGDSTGLLR